MTRAVYLNTSEHPVFSPPAAADAKIWRYVDLPRLLSLLSRRALFLGRADRLGDAWEGSIGLVTMAQRTEMLLAAGIPASQISRMVDTGPDSRIQRQNFAVQCWHVNDDESAAMWANYTAQGVAIQSRFNALCRQIPSLPDPRPAEAHACDVLFIGMVRYIDYRKEPIFPDNNAMTAIMHKRRSFQHERELRLLVDRSYDYFRAASSVNPHVEGKSWNVYDAGYIDVFPEGGVYVSVNVEDLIENIYVHPNQPTWFADVVRDAVTAFGFPALAQRVRQSDMAEDPVF